MSAGGTGNGLALMVVCGLVGFGFGFATKQAIDHKVLAAVFALANRAVKASEAVPTCSSADALAWWTAGRDLEQVKGQLCGKKPKESRSVKP